MSSPLLRDHDMGQRLGFGLVRLHRVLEDLHADVAVCYVSSSPYLALFSKMGSPKKPQENTSTFHPEHTQSPEVFLRRSGLSHVAQRHDCSRVICSSSASCMPMDRARPLRDGLKPFPVLLGGGLLVGSIRQCRRFRECEASQRDLGRLRCQLSKTTRSVCKHRVDAKEAAAACFSMKECSRPDWAVT